MVVSCGTIFCSTIFANLRSNRENINREINGRVQRCGHLLAHAHVELSSVLVFIMALLKYFKKSSVLPNPDGQQTKKSRACLLRSKMRPAQ